MYVFIVRNSTFYVASEVNKHIIIIYYYIVNYACEYVFSTDFYSKSSRIKMVFDIEKTLTIE